MTSVGPAGIAASSDPAGARRWDWGRERLRERLDVHAEAIRETVLAPLLVELDRPTADALRRDREGWPALLDRLLDGLDLGSTLRLLSRDQPIARPAPIPDLAWQEAALDAASSDAAASDAVPSPAAPPDPASSAAEIGLNRRCTCECVRQAAAALDRLAVPPTLRERLLSLLPGMPPAGGGEPVLVEAILSGRHDAMRARLSAATGLSAAAVDNALVTANRRGLVAMAWKAGYGMRTAWLLQVLGAGIEPHRALDADADGGCPLGRAEMAWQIGFMERAARG